MKVVLLAGGFGSRISEESQFKPKPMIEICGMPILWHIMKEYAYYGYNEFIICAGYKQEYIKEWFANYFLYNSDVSFNFRNGKNEITVHHSNLEPWKVTIVDTGYNTLTGGRIKRIKEYVNNETFMMTYGDGVCDVDINKLVAFHKKHGKIATLTAVIQAQDKGVLNIDENNSIRSFREKNINDGVPINAGYMVLEPRVFDYIEGDQTIFEKEPLNKLATEGELMSYTHKGFWQCMDNIREKNLLEQLLIDGVAPWKKMGKRNTDNKMMMFMRNIRLSKSCIGKEEIDAVTDVLHREYLGMGQDVHKFEDDLKDFFGRDVTLVNTGTAALHLAVQGVGIKDGDEVLVQSLTYVACFQAIRATGGIPVACDVDDDTLTIDLDDAERKLTPKTKAIMPVHYAGQCGNLDAIYEFAKKHNLRVIEDASHAFGTYYKGRLIGSFGDVVCISMDGIKNITSGEGGMIITEDLDVQKIIKDARLLSVQNDTDSRFKGTRTWVFDVNQPGWRYHMSNIMAAIGYTQLKKFPKFKEIRQRLAKIYQQELDNVKGIKIIPCNYNEVVPHIFVIRITCGKRDIVKQCLNDNGVATGIHYRPNHLLTLFTGNQNNTTLKHTDEIYEQLITLPLHTDMVEDDVYYICGLIKKSI